MVSRMTQDIYNRWTEWESRQLEDPDLTREMQEIMADPEHRDERIHDCCYKDLEFGTGGLREIMGVGTNRMNICTVSRGMLGGGENERYQGGDCLRQPVEVLGFCLHIGRGICCVRIPGLHVSGTGTDPHAFLRGSLPGMRWRCDDNSQP